MGRCYDGVLPKGAIDERYGFAMLPGVKRGDAIEV
jgi:hypothetical protein